MKTGRVLAGVTFEVHAKITDAGSGAFRTYLARLRALLADIEGPDAGGPTPTAGAAGGLFPSPQ